MKAVFHRDIKEEEVVEVLDIFVDKEGEPRVLFIGSDNRIATAPTNRFTDFENEGHATRGQGPHE